MSKQVFINSRQQEDGCTALSGKSKFKQEFIIESKFTSIVKFLKENLFFKQHEQIQIWSQREFTWYDLNKFIGFLK